MSLRDIRAFQRKWHYELRTMHGCHGVASLPACIVKIPVRQPAVTAPTTTAQSFEAAETSQSPSDLSELLDSIAWSQRHTAQQKHCHASTREAPEMRIVGLRK